LVEGWWSCLVEAYCAFAMDFDDMRDRFGKLV
jgi:hypothetical protein